MNRRRVLFVLGSLGFGGTERQVVEILRRLDRQRFEPSLYVIYKRGELVSQVPSDVPIISYWDRYRTPKLQIPGRTLWSQIRDLTRTIRSERIDIVYDRGSHMAITAGMATPADVGRLSVVVADPELDFKNAHPRFRWIKRPLLRRGYSRADRVVAVSNGVRDGLIRFHALPPRQVVMCPNIFDFGRIRELAAAVAPEFTPDRFHIACVGRLQREKGQQVLLQAVEQVVRVRNRPEVLLWIIGDGPDAELLRKFVADRGLQDHVRFEGYQANPLPYTKRASVFCLPSLFEGMPNALVEAMGCGTPVIASDCASGPSEILVGGNFGRLVPPANPDALADALDDACRNLIVRTGASPDPDGWRERAQAAQRHVENTYSVSVGLRQLESLLVEVAAEKGR